MAGWQRKWAQGGQREHTVVLINYDTRVAAADMTDLPAGARLVSAYPAGGATATKADAPGKATLLLAPQSLRVLVVQTGAQPGRAAPRRPAPTKAAGKTQAGNSKKKSAAPAKGARKKPG